jgi:hypothetical protein
MNRLVELLHDRVVVGLLSSVGLLVLIGQAFIWYPRYALDPGSPDDGLDFRIYERAAARAARGLTPSESCAHAPKAPPSCVLYPPPFAAAIALPALLRAVLPIAAALATWLSLRKQPERLRASLCGVAAMSCAPICWWKYGPILLIPGAVWISGLDLAAPARTRA